jgi:hypothetical protein
VTSSDEEPLTAHPRECNCCPTSATETSYLQRCLARRPAIRTGSCAGPDSRSRLVCTRFGRNGHGVAPQHRAKPSRIAHHVIPPGQTAPAQDVHIQFTEDQSRYPTASEHYNWCRATYRPQLSSLTHACGVFVATVLRLPRVAKDFKLPHFPSFSFMALNLDNERARDAASCDNLEAPNVSKRAILVCEAVNHGSNGVGPDCRDFFG